MALKLFGDRKKSGQEKPAGPGSQSKESVDMDKVEQIVKKMKSKYKDEGRPLEAASGELEELRGIIAEGHGAKIEVQRIEELQELKNPLIQKLGTVFLRFQGFFRPIVNVIKELPASKELSFYLESANVRLSTQQYLAITAVVSVIMFLIGWVVGSVLFSAMTLNILVILPVGILVGFIVWLITIIFMLFLPRKLAQMRGEAVTREMPFALRHMATELKAGISLYRTIQAIATAGYGALSEEFSWVVTQIEEGTDTKDALRNLALRTQSVALRSALLHIIRALKTGGNLSDVMETIAEDVSFELRARIQAFAEALNFFGVIFIFIAIVLPVFIAILGGVRNTPLQIGSGSSIFSVLPLAPENIAVIYLVIMPIVLATLIAYIAISQPRS
ncbi:MAG: type II secretion system F family protein [Candidatus Diapherotrites archaeon]|nr:type II secretion system F family protein [Candidatus Diapherotrites archaeon]